MSKVTKDTCIGCSLPACLGTTQEKCRETVRRQTLVELGQLIRPGSIQEQQYLAQTGYCVRRGS